MKHIVVDLEMNNIRQKSEAKDDEGNAKYDIESIYTWLDYIRQLGLEQVFK